MAQRNQRADQGENRVSIQNPHFAPTFALTKKGSKVVEQGSPEDLQARAKNVLVCPVGFRADRPEFGAPPTLFETIPLNVRGIHDAVAKWAEVDAAVTEAALPEALSSRQITVEVG